MKYVYQIILLLLSSAVYAQTTYVRDAITKEPVSYATISFGDGKGTFAGEEGELLFRPEKYSDIDSIFVSSIGYIEMGLSTNNLPNEILLFPNTNQLKAVILTAEKRGKFKKKKYKPTSHIDYFNSWLPTVESEVAILFNREDAKSTKIATLYLPINSEKKYRKKGNKKFSTMFRIQFYENVGGLPGEPLDFKDIIFRVSEQNDEVYELDLAQKSIFIPENGLFAAIQVLGYTDPQGKLLQTKKYSEVETRRGIQKVSTTFRPLLPFTNKLPHQKTFVRRIFFNNKKWQIFDQSYNENSGLVKSGFVNYGMGALLHVYD